MTTMTNPADEAAVDAALKAKHAAMWALGDYPTVARQLIPGLGAELVHATRIGPGDRVLDVAAGPGNAAIPAALTGAEVVASDLTPELVEVGRNAGERAGAQLEWRVADAEALPFGDAEFDVVVSCVGVMFAPHHERSAAEITRVTRRGGRLGLISWTPEGFIGQMFAAMRPYAAPPPPGATPPPLWGREEHVRGLFGPGYEGFVAERRVVAETFPEPHAFREFFKANYGPTIAAYRFLGEDLERVTALDATLDALAAEHSDASGCMEWEYLLLTATRR